MPILLNGKHVAKLIRSSLAEQVAALLSQSKSAPHLAIVLVGDDPASHTYVRHKVSACQEVGIQTTVLSKTANIQQATLLQLIQKVNEDPTIHGIIIQLPLPQHITAREVIEAIDPHKDVDGLHPLNYGRMACNLSLPIPLSNMSFPPTTLDCHALTGCFGPKGPRNDIAMTKQTNLWQEPKRMSSLFDQSHIPATPLGILMLLAHYQIETTGKHCVIVGRGPTVGAPLSILMSRNTYLGNATVTLCHSHTQDLASLTRQADILVAAVGKPGLITANMVQPGTIIIDVGITRVPDATKKSGYRLQGDVDFETVSPLCEYITPVPGGVGPMTIAALIANTVRAATGQVC